MVGVPSSCALLGGFSIGAWVSLLWQHSTEHEMSASACTRSMPGWTRSHFVGNWVCSLVETLSDYWSYLLSRMLMEATPALPCDGCSSSVPLTWYVGDRNTVELRYDPTTDDRPDGTVPKTAAKRFVAHFVVANYCLCVTGRMLWVVIDGRSW